MPALKKILGQRLKYATLESLICIKILLNRGMRVELQKLQNFRWLQVEPFVLKIDERNPNLML